MSPPYRAVAVVVNWNGRRYLPRCLESLARSTLPVRVVVVDNASTDGSIEYLRAHHPDVQVIALAENVGYAGGANVGIERTAEEFVMIMNPDVILAPDHLVVLTDRMDGDATIGAAQGKLLQIRPEDYLAGKLDNAHTLDSAGHAVRRSRMVVDIGQGRPASSGFDRERSVFSACGAALLLRREMLDDTAVEGTYFDPSFFAYKEDIDLCWRARLLGWDIRHVPDALGYHVRGWAGSRPPPAASLPLAARRHSWKNHYLLIIKNDAPLDVLKALPFIAGWEVLRQGHALLRDRALYGAYGDLWRLLPRALRHRRTIMSRRRIGTATLGRWFGEKRGLLPNAAAHLRKEKEPHGQSPRRSET